MYELYCSISVLDQICTCLLCVYICVHGYICVCECVYMHVYMCVCVCVCVCVCACVWACIHVFVRMCVNACVNEYPSSLPMRGDIATSLRVTLTSSIRPWERDPSTSPTAQQTPNNPPPPSAPNTASRCWPTWANILQSGVCVWRGYVPSPLQCVAVCCCARPPDSASLIRPSLCRRSIEEVDVCHAYLDQAQREIMRSARVLWVRPTAPLPHAVTRMRCDTQTHVHTKQIYIYAHSNLAPERETHTCAH